MDSTSDLSGTFACSSPWRPAVGYSWDWRGSRAGQAGSASNPRRDTAPPQRKYNLQAGLALKNPPKKTHPKKPKKTT